MGTQRIPRSRSALYTNAGKKRKCRTVVAKRRAYRQAAAAGVMIDPARLDMRARETGEGQ